MTIPRDDKDWTWVLQRPCPECGFDSSTITGEQVGERLRSQVPTWRRVLATGHATVRPDESTWSPTEYACHVRDVSVLYARRLHRMLTENDPEYLNWSSDDAAIDGAYDRQQPEAVLVQLERDLGQLADAFDAVTAQEWTRPGRRSDGASFTVDSFARYLLHDVEHHGWDVTRASDARE